MIVRESTVNQWGVITMCKMKDAKETVTNDLLNEELLTAYEELTASEEELHQQFDELLVKEEAIYRQNTVLNLLHDIAINLMSDLRHDDVLQKIMDGVRDLFGTPNRFVYLVDAEIQTYTVTIGTGVFNELDKEGIITEGLIGQAYRTGNIAVVENYNSWPDRLANSIFDTIYYFALVPLKHNDKMIGAIGLAFSEPERILSEDELSLFQRFADLASFALGNAALLDSLHTEIVERKQLETVLLNSRNMMILAAGLANLGVWEYDLKTKVYNFNDEFYAVYGTNVAREGQFMSFDTYVREFVHPEDIWMFEEERQLYFSDGKVPLQDVEHRIIRRDGVVRNILVRRNNIKDSNGKIIKLYGTNQDITEVLQVDAERKKQAKTIKHMAYFDSLTGLANRHFLNEWLKNEMEGARLGKSNGSILFIDLDDLKMINDTYGHSYGDKIIHTAGIRIRDRVGEKAFVSRIGGDEFVVILPGASDRENVRKLVQQVSKSIGKEQEIFGGHFHMTASIGIAFYPDDGDTAEEIIKNADNAMYAAKKESKDCWRFYTEKMQIDVYEKMRLTGSLRHALDRNELSLVYQPQISALDRKLIGFEVLLRWNSPEYGNVSPMQFIPLAEQSGLINRIGMWVLRESCQFARRLSEKGGSGVRVAVNISSKQLAVDDFIVGVCNAVNAAGIDPQQLELEITESVLIQSMDDAIGKLLHLQKFGVKLSLDDFGTGFSSLTYLRQLPVETVKIDKSFIDMITTDVQGAKIIASVINMAHAINMKVVAEGVETEAQLEYLLDKDCDIIQGYLFSCPIVEVAAMKFLADNSEA